MAEFSNVKHAVYMLLTDRKAYPDPVREKGRRRLAELVGFNVFDARRPQGTPPMAITLQRNAGAVEMALSGAVDCAQPVVSVDLWMRETESTRVSDIEDAYRAIEAILIGFRGTVAGMTIHTITPDSEPYEATERPFAGDDQWTYRYNTTWKVCHTRPVPALNTPAYVQR